MPDPTEQTRTLIVLGAGASIGAERYPIRDKAFSVFPYMPSSRHFFYDLFQRNSQGKDRGSFNMLGMLYEGVERLVRQSWGLSLEEKFIPEEWRDVNIEDVLSFVDVGTRMYTRGSDYHRAFRHSREALIDFITMMLMTRSHGQHCELFTEIAYTLKPKDTVINFNYDTIAEFTLQRIRRRQYTNYARLMSGSLPKVKDYEDLGLLLKLHGSVNWRTCSNRSCKLHKVPHIAFTNLRRRLPMGLANVSSPCRECAAERPSTAIIPPMSEKNLAKYDFFHRLWLIARAQLPYFKRIAFVGYSFPPNDAYSEWLFRQLRFISDYKLPTITVANPEAVKSRSLVRQRYQSIFRGFDVEYVKDLESLTRIWR